MLFYYPDLNGDSITLNKEESSHCIKVLRKREGDVVHFTDGKGTLATGTIQKADVKKCIVDIQSKEKKEAEKHHIHIAVAPTKNIDRMGWFVEKSVELGIQEISFIYCTNSERKVMKTEKMHAKAISAIKQSLAPFLPIINAPVNFKDFVSTDHQSDQKFIAHLDNDHIPDLFLKSSTSRNYCVLIGPEGDFTQEELKLAIENGYEMVKLGKKRLRTETAALAACHTLNLVNIL